MGKYECILVEKKDKIGIVKLNRPERKNAYTRILGAELRDAIARYDLDDDIRCIIVTGVGETFSVGAEVSYLDKSKGDPQKLTFEQIAQERGLLIRHPSLVKKPIIAAINGNAVGVGITLPLQYDIRIVAEDAKLGFVFVRRGFTPEAGSHWILPRLIGMTKASELLLTGRIFSGIEAVEMGLANKAVQKNQVLDTAIQFAKEITTQCSPLAVALTKRQLWAYLAEPSFVQSQTIESDIHNWMRKQPDTVEGVKAFVEKRDPSWQSHLSKDFPSDLPSLVR